MKDIFPNLDVVREVTAELDKKVEWVSQSYNELIEKKATGKIYDDRDLYSIAYILISLDGVPEEQQEQYFKSEFAKIVSDFETLDPKTGRPDPKKVSGQLKRIYEAYANSARTEVDWNDKKSVEQYIHTMIMAQTVYTMVKNFPSEYMDAFPSIKERRELDMLILQRTALGNRSLRYLKDNGLDLQKYNILSLISEQVRDKHIFEEHMNEMVGKAFLENGGEILLDPTVTPRTQELFMKQPITGSYYDADIEETIYYDTDTVFTDMDQIYEGMIKSTVFEKSVTLNALNRQYTDFYLINGKSLSAILDERQAFAPRERMEQTNILLRDALTDGKSVVEIVNFGFDKSGKHEIERKQLKVDLDKLNAEDYKSHNIFRRALHRMNIWRIPPKYASNEQRNEAQAEVAAGLGEAYRSYEKTLVKNLNDAKQNLANRGYEYFKDALPEFSVKSEEKKLDAGVRKALFEDDDSEVEFVPNPDLKNLKPPVFSSPDDVRKSISVEDVKEEVTHVSPPHVSTDAPVKQNVKE